MIIQRHEPEQILAAGLAGKGIPLQVQEQIARRGFWQPTESLFNLDRLKQFENRLVRPSRLDLNASLLSNANIGRHRTSARFEPERQRCPCQVDDRLDASRLKFSALDARDACHEGQMV